MRRLTDKQAETLRLLCGVEQLHDDTRAMVALAGFRIGGIPDRGRRISWIASATESTYDSAWKCLVRLENAGLVRAERRGHQGTVFYYATNLGRGELDYYDDTRPVRCVLVAYDLRSSSAVEVQS